MSEIHKDHRSRLKTRFLKEGLSNFPDHNKLELLLFFAIPRKDTNEMAHSLLEHFGSLGAVLEAPVEELQKVEGIGENAAILLKLIPAFSSAYLADISDAELLDSTDKMGKHLIPKFIGESNEVLYLVLLDAQSRLIATRKVSEGDKTQTEVSIRRIAEICLQTGAVSVVVAHNHPRGKALPSRADLLISSRITRALEPIGVHVIDHMIIAGEDYLSLGPCKDQFSY